MKKYLILIIMLIMVCTGCSVTYTVDISEDMSAKENVIALENNEFFSQYEHSSKGRVIGFLLEPYLEKLNDNKYNSKAYIPPTKSGGGAIVEKKYSNVKELFEKSIITGVFTDKVEYTEKGSKITIKAKGNFSHNQQDQSRIPVDTAKIKIKVPFKVTENNADSVDGNTYTWVFKETDTKDRELVLKFDKSRTESPINSFPFIVIGIIILIVIVGLIIFNVVKSKNEEINKF